MPRSASPPPSTPTYTSASKRDAIDTLGAAPSTTPDPHGNGGEHPWCSPPSTTAVRADQSRQNRHPEKQEFAEVNLSARNQGRCSPLFKQFAPDFTMNEHLIANARAQQRLQTLNTLNRIDCTRYWSCNLLDEVRSKAILFTRLRHFSR